MVDSIEAFNINSLNCFGVNERLHKSVTLALAIFLTAIAVASALLGGLSLMGHQWTLLQFFNQAFVAIWPQLPLTLFCMGMTTLFVEAVVGLVIYCIVMSQNSQRQESIEDPEDPPDQALSVVPNEAKETEASQVTVELLPAQELPTITELPLIQPPKVNKKIGRALQEGFELHSIEEVEKYLTKFLPFMRQEGLLYSFYASEDSSRGLIKNDYVVVTVADNKLYFLLGILRENPETGVLEENPILKNAPTDVYIRKLTNIESRFKLYLEYQMRKQGT